MGDLKGLPEHDPDYVQRMATPLFIFSKSNEGLATWTFWGVPTPPRSTNPLYFCFSESIHSSGGSKCPDSMGHKKPTILRPKGIYTHLGGKKTFSGLIFCFLCQTSMSASHVFLYLGLCVSTFFPPFERAAFLSIELKHVETTGRSNHQLIA